VRRKIAKKESENAAGVQVGEMLRGTQLFPRCGAGQPIKRNRFLQRGGDHSPTHCTSLVKVLQAIDIRDLKP
jgi:hypothetical protein